MPYPTAEGQFVLCHSVYVTIDPASGRLGNLCSHLLMEIRPDQRTQSASLRAISSWHSAAWIRDATELPLELPDVHELPAGALTNTMLTTYAERATGRERLLFIMNALVTRPGRRVFLAATQDEAALLTYGAARLLPTSVLGALTFSTYERYPEDTTTRLTATWWPQLEHDYLPERLYEGIGFALHCGTGKRSKLPAEYPWISGLLGAMLAGDTSAIARFHDLCQESSSTDPMIADLLWTYFCAPERVFIQPHHIERLAGSPVVTAMVVKDEGYCGQMAHLLASLTRNNPTEGFTHEAWQLLEVCAQSIAMWQPLSNSLTQLAYGYLADGDITRGQHIVAAMLPKLNAGVASQAQAGVYEEVRQRLSSAAAKDRLSLDARVAIVRLSFDSMTEATKAQSDSFLDEWFDPQPSEVIRWLRPDIPNAIRLIVGVYAQAWALMPVDYIVDALQDQLGLRSTIWAQLIAERQDHAAEAWLSACADSPAQLLNALQVANETLPSEAFMHGAAPVITQFVSNLDEQTAQMSTSARLLEWVAAHSGSLSPATAKRARAWNVWVDFLHSPSIAKAWSVRTVAPTLREATRNRAPSEQNVQVAIARATRSQSDIESFLLELGPAFVADPEAFLLGLLQAASTWRLDEVNLEIFPALAGVSLGAANDSRLRRALSAARLSQGVEDMVSALDRRAFAAIVRASTVWPEHVRKRWENLAITRNDEPLARVSDALDGAKARIKRFWSSSHE